jgi:magnesium transporter
MRILIAKNGEGVKATDNLVEIRNELKNPESLVWVDLNSDSIEDCRRILTDEFKFHPLSVDDALVETHIPKIDDWEDYLYLSLIAVKPDQPLEDLDKSIEMDVFLGKNYIVTYHPEEIRAIDLIWGNFQRDERRLLRGSNYILYHIMDELANDYMAMIDQIDLNVEIIEDQVMEKPDNKLLQQIFSIKRSLLNLRRIVAPEREVLNKLSRGDFEVIGQKERMYYRDVYDHLVRVHDITESLRDLATGALDTYLSVVNNRLNDIMKTLTIITTIFMPLSFLTGFFGMNFFGPGNQLNNWTGSYAFYFMLAVFIGLPLTMFLWMRKRDWM